MIRFMSVRRYFVRDVLFCLIYNVIVHIKCAQHIRNPLELTCCYGEFVTLASDSSSWQRHSNMFCN